MNEQLSELRAKINEEVNHRTYSPLLFCMAFALLSQHYEVALYLLDSSLTSAEKISNVDSYWKSGQSIFRSLLSGGAVFLVWCFLHPISALTWDLIRRSIIWVRKTKIHKIPVIPESDYEALEDEYRSERKRLNLEHSDMAVKVESIKAQLENSKNDNQRKKEEITKIKSQLSEESARLIKSHRTEISQLEQSLNREVNTQKDLVARSNSDLSIQSQEIEKQKKELLELKLEIFDRDNWAEDSSSFIESGFSCRIAFDYLSPAVESQIISFFSQENTQFQRNMSSDFSFAWVRNKKGESAKQKLYEKGVDFLSFKFLDTPAPLTS